MVRCFIFFFFAFHLAVAWRCNSLMPVQIVHCVSLDLYYRANIFGENEQDFGEKKNPPKPHVNP
jgi:hypothetical protein